VGLSVAHTDNVELANDGFGHSERVTDVRTGFNFSRSQPRLEADVSYQAEGVFYGKLQDSDEVFHQLDAAGRFALISDRLFLDMFGVYGQTLVDPTQKYSVNNLAVTGNRMDVALLGVSPTIDLGIGENVTGELSQGATRVNYDSPTVQDSTERFVHFDLGNTGKRDGGSWTTRYSRERFEYERSNTVELENVEVDLGRWFRGGWRLFTTQGLESDYAGLEASGELDAGGLQQHYWYVGTNWQPDPRSDLEVSFGDRAFGQAHRFAFSRRFRGGGISIDYSEEPSTFLRDQIGAARVTGELAPIDSLDGANGNQLYLQERFNVALALARAKSDVGFRVFDEKRFEIGTDLGSDTDPTETRRGAEASFGWRLNSRTSLAASAQVVNRFSVVNVVHDKLRYLSLQMRRRIGTKQSAYMNLSRESSWPSSDVSGENQYEQNYLVIGVERSFGADNSGGFSRRYAGYAGVGRVR